MSMFTILILIAIYIDFGAPVGLEISFERVQVRYVNPKYFEYIRSSTGRAGRNKPYALTVEFHNLIPIGNNVMVDMLLNELMSNGRYQPTPIQMYKKTCEFFYNEPLLGQVLQRTLNITCPLIIKEHSYKNIVIDMSLFPYHLPFAWDHQVATHTRGDAAAYHIQSRDIMFNASIFITITQKPTLKKPLL